MAILYRPARIDDIQRVSHVYWQSVLHVYDAHGFGYKRHVYPLNPYYAFALQEEPGGFFVAEDEGKVVGATISWVRGHLWFLSHLFILPHYQGQGIGKALMGRALEYCDQPQCRPSQCYHHGLQPCIHCPVYEKWHVPSWRTFIS